MAYKDGNLLRARGVLSMPVAARLLRIDRPEQRFELVARHAAPPVLTSRRRFRFVYLFIYLFCSLSASYLIIFFRVSALRVDSFDFVAASRYKRSCYDAMHCRRWCRPSIAAWSPCSSACCAIFELITFVTNDNFCRICFAFYRLEPRLTRLLATLTNDISPGNSNLDGHVIDGQRIATLNIVVRSFVSFRSTRVDIDRHLFMRRYQRR